MVLLWVFSVGIGLMLMLLIEMVFFDKIFLGLSCLFLLMR